MAASIGQVVKQTFLALLCLCASLAYATRESQNDVLLAALSQLYPTAQLDALDGCGAEHHSHTPHQKPHDHAGHCPFCFVAAFGLAVAGTFLLFAAAFYCWLCLVCPHVSLQWPRRFLARAPPVLAC